MIVGMLAEGHTAEEVLRMYPYLEAADIPAALEYAAWRSQEEEFPLTGHEVPPRHEPLAGVGAGPAWGRTWCSSLVQSRTAQRGRWGDLSAARQDNLVLITMDLDFTAILANGRAGGPSVVQIRSNDVSAKTIGGLVIATLKAAARCACSRRDRLARPRARANQTASSRVIDVA
jgi:hypothetical protein